MFSMKQVRNCNSVEIIHFNDDPPEVLTYLNFISSSQYELFV